MGRIKTAKIKRKAIEIIKLHEEKLGKDYAHNKEAMKSLVKVESKKMANVIAGYITRLMKSRSKQSIIEKA